MISIHLMVKNERDLVLALVPYLKQHFAEVIVLDTGSTDDTVAIAMEHGAIVFWQDMSGDWDFGTARNRAIANATMPWILWIDADEWPTLELIEWCKTFVADAPTEVLGIAIRRENLLDGKPIGTRTYEWHVRLFRRGCRIAGRLHERVILAPDRVVKAPEQYLLLHHKTTERQERQNEFYKQWPEQPRN